jgi:outer membrane immunogenic protein
MKKFIVFAALIAVPGVAAAEDMSGARVEARLGYETPTISGDGDVYKIGSAVSFGAELGYDLKLGENTTFGPYAIYELSSVKACAGADCLEEKGNLGIGGRVGFAVSDAGQIYGKLGYASIKFKATTATGATGTDTQNGVQGAVGYRHNFGKSLHGLIELNYADYGKFVGVNLQRRHVAIGLGANF